MPPKPTAAKADVKKGAKPAAKTAAKVAEVKAKTASTKKSFGIGQAVQPKRDMGRFVKWPKYVRLQRQHRVLYKRLKVPPSINQFTHTLNKNHATELFRLLNKYRPEDKAAKKLRLADAAKTKAAKGEVAKGDKPVVVKYGINHIAALVEKKKAQLVVIAHDVDPIEVLLSCGALSCALVLPAAPGRCTAGARLPPREGRAGALSRPSARRLLPSLSGARARGVCGSFVRGRRGRAESFRHWNPLFLSHAEPGQTPPMRPVPTAPRWRHPPRRRDSHTQPSPPNYFLSSAPRVRGPSFPCGITHPRTTRLVSLPPRPLILRATLPVDGGG